MAFSVSPSVIVREVDASQTVPGVATAPAAMAGIFKWGPVNDPILITSETQLVDRFGKPTDDNYETFFTASDYLSYASALYVVRADDGSNTASSTTLDITEETVNGDVIVTDNSTYGAFEAKYQGELGNNIEVSWSTSKAFSSEIEPVGGIEGNQISNNSISQTIDFNSNSVQWQTATTLDANNAVTATNLNPIYAGDVIVIGNNGIGYQELVVSTVTTTPVTEEVANTDVQTATTTELTFTTRYTLAETSLNKLSIVRKWSQNTLFGKAPDASHIHITVTDKLGGITGTPNTVLEVFDNVSTIEGASSPQGQTNYYETVIENKSSWVKVANTAVITAGIVNDNSANVTARSNNYEQFLAGSDATTESTATLAALGFAWDQLKNSNEIDISFILQGKGDPGATRANYIVANVAEYRKDCVAFLSPDLAAVVTPSKLNDKLENAIAYRNLVQNSSYSFMDSGYKYRYDKFNDQYRWTPLNGDMAGLASRVDAWESPAGYRKGVIKNIIKLAFNPSKPQRDALYTADINPVMSQTGRGIVLFGDKTGLGMPSAFDRLNVRRLFIAIEKSIATAAEGFLFEFNDDFTQTQFKNIVDPFLRDIQGRRGITDFRVVSDATVNTPEVIDQNKFRASIFVKPARSINVIELTFVATRTGVEFDEIVGQLT